LNFIDLCIILIIYYDEVVEHIGNAIGIIAKKMVIDISKICFIL